MFLSLAIMIEKNELLVSKYILENKIDKFNSWFEDSSYKRLAEQVAPDKLPELILANNYYAFSYSAENGYLNILKWLAEKAAPDKIQEVIAAHNYSGFRKAAQRGELNILKWLSEMVAPSIFQQMIAADDYYAFREAVRYDKTNTFKWLAEKVTPDKSQAMVETCCDYLGFVHAAEDGFLNTLTWLAEKVAANKVQEMIAAYNYLAFRYAARHGRIKVLKWLEEQVASDKFQEMIAADDYYAFRKAAMDGRLNTLKWLAEKVVPDKLQEMIIAGNYSPFIHNPWSFTRDYLLSIDDGGLFNYVEQHDEEYGANYVYPLVAKKLNELAQEQQRQGIQRPSEVFNLEPNEARYYFYILRNLIRRSLNDLAVPLLLIPAVANLAHQNNNELLRLAMSIANNDGARSLLNLPQVRELATQNNYYAAEQGRGVNIRDLAQDRESSMHALTQGEQSRMKKLEAKYLPIINKRGGIEARFSAFKAALEQIYKKNPATFRGQPLPLTKKSFDKLGLAGEALTAYYQHCAHSAWRYICKPNPWMAANADFVTRDYSQRGWSSFEQYKAVIVYLWLAAADEFSPATEGYSVETRVAEFIRSIALIGRAHNWDKERRNKETGFKEQYDDLEGDKPSCYSGVKRRLFQSLKGCGLYTIINKDIIDMEIKDFVAEQYKPVIKKLSNEEKQAILQAYEDIIFKLDDFSEHKATFLKFNIPEEKIQLFIKTLNSKYGSVSLKEFSTYLDDLFKINDSHCHAANFGHLFRIADYINTNAPVEYDNNFENSLEFTNENFAANGVETENINRKPAKKIASSSLFSRVIPIDNKPPDDAGSVSAPKN